MTKAQFDKELKMATSALPKDEQRRIQSHYDGLYAEKRNKNIPEEAIMLGFGNPKLIVEEVTGESIFNRQIKEFKSFFQKIMQSHTFWVWYFSLFFITMPLTIALAAIGLVIGAAVFAIVVSFVCVAFVAILGVPVFVGCGIIQMCNGALWVGMCTVGVGITCIAAAILCLGILRVMNYVRVHFFYARRNRLAKYNDMKMHGRTRRKILSIICAVSLVIGLTVFGVAYWKMGYDNSIFHGTDLIKTIKETIDLVKKK